MRIDDTRDAHVACGTPIIAWVAFHCSTGGLKIYDLPFLFEETKRKVLGGSALKRFDMGDTEAVVSETDA